MATKGPMTPGEIQAALKAKWKFEVFVSAPGRGKINIMMGQADAEALARGLPAIATPRTALPTRPTPKKEMPDELQLAMDAAGDHQFVISCAEQWEERGSLTEAQLAGLAKFVR